MQSYLQSFIKTLTKSEVDLFISNQHELHGVSQLQSIFGVIPKGDGRIRRFPATIRIGSQGKIEHVDISWYNARANDESRHEYRLYYSGSFINQNVKAGDNIFIGLTKGGGVEIIIFPVNRQSRTYNDWTVISGE